MMTEPKKGKWDSSDDEDGDVKLAVTKKRKVDNVDADKSVSTTISTAEVVIDMPTVDAMDCTAAESPSKTISVDDVLPITEQSVSPNRSPIPPIISDNASDTLMSVDQMAESVVPAAKPVDIVEHNPLHHGCRSVDEYIRLNFIDQGTYGVVFRARCKKTNRIYALKQVKIGKEAAKVGFPVTALRETNILLALKHPNIVR